MKSSVRQVKKNLSPAELETEIFQTKEKIFRLNFKKSSAARLENPREIRYLRRDIARFKTWLAEKGRATGVR